MQTRQRDGITEVAVAVGPNRHEWRESVVIEHGAGGLGDAMQGLWIVAGLAADRPSLSLEYRFGPVMEWVKLFDVPGVTYGAQAKRTMSNPCRASYK